MPSSHTPRPATGYSRIWRWLAAISVFGNIILNYYSNAFPFNGQSMGDVSAKYPTLLTPAGYAFSIWGLIFLSLAVYSVWQLLPAQRTTGLPDAVAKPLTLASIATASWVVLFAYELIIPSVVTMLLILGALIVAYGRARRRTIDHKAPRWASLPFGLYLGWISVASTINITIGLRQLGWQPGENVLVLLTLALLAVVVVVALLLSRQFQEETVALVVAWALVAIWVARRAEYPELAWAALAGAVLAVLGSFVLASRRRRRSLGV
ncbi:tryptophan-rich sensory protein [Hymenobacter sediminicola]|uniref:Tryptophan-rich sensory protein n=1 Tax=Hymenobacter sediminicola TaxID=2761579 RepID=A0A7G7W8R4_9BACT|nr:tryptophan-rich sensory protein [Hymenobacter sediminicola]QNH62757.1 tryptophan-rich sensory protein [Hymenobacter sediminicola]